MKYEKELSNELCDYIEERVKKKLNPLEEFFNDEKPYFLSIPTICVGDERISDASFRYLALLFGYARVKGYAYASNGHYEKELRYGRSKAARCLKELQDNNYIFRVELKLHKNTERRLIFLQREALFDFCKKFNYYKSKSPRFYTKIHKIDALDILSLNSTIVYMNINGIEEVLNYVNDPKDSIVNLTNK